MIQTLTLNISPEELQFIIEGAIEKAFAKLPKDITKEAPITRRELMTRLQVSEPTVLRWEKSKKIPFLRIGDLIRYDWAAVLHAMSGVKQKK